MTQITVPKMRKATSADKSCRSKVRHQFIIPNSLSTKISHIYSGHKKTHRLLLFKLPQILFRYFCVVFKLIPFWQFVNILHFLCAYHWKWWYFVLEIFSLCSYLLYCLMSVNRSEWNVKRKKWIFYSYPVHIPFLTPTLFSLAPTTTPQEGLMVMANFKLY